MVSSAGGKPREASVGFDNQGAPTWSPDSKWLVYGNVECHEEGICAIHKIDFLIGREYFIPGSEGLGTARWSPDGLHIAALDSDRQQVFVLDLAAQEWRILVDGVNGNDLCWSADSKFIYASRPVGDHPQILRVSVKDGRREAAVDLSDVSKQIGHLDTWFTLTPDSSIIVLRSMDRNEIYALPYDEK